MKTFAPVLCTGVVRLFWKSASLGLQILKKLFFLIKTNFKMITEFDVDMFTIRQGLHTSLNPNHALLSRPALSTFVTDSNQLKILFYQLSASHLFRLLESGHPLPTLDQNWFAHLYPFLVIPKPVKPKQRHNSPQNKRQTSREAEKRQSSSQKRCNSGLSLKQTKKYSSKRSSPKVPRCSGKLVIRKLSLSHIPHRFSVLLQLSESSISPQSRITS